MCGAGRMLIIAGLFCGGWAAADTLYLKDGVQIDGKISAMPNGLYQVRIGDRTILYRESEVDRVEQNERTGRIDRQEALRRWAEQDKQLTEQFGLSAEQRRKVDALLYKLQREEERVGARNQLIAMQQEHDILPYLAFRFTEVSHRLSPWVLETLAYIDARRVLETIRGAVLHPYFGTRAKAIELLGMLQDKASVELVARGLVDHKPEVQFPTAYALANLGAKEATPALTDLLGSTDQRVRNASLDALQKLWAAELGDAKPEQAEQWAEIWKSHAISVGKSISLDGLLPLVAPEEEFQDE